MFYNLIDYYQQALEKLKNIVRNPFEENEEIASKTIKSKKKIANLLKAYSEFIQSDIISGILNKALPRAPNNFQYDDNISDLLNEAKELLKKSSNMGCLDSKYLLMRMNFVFLIIIFSLEIMDIL